MSIVGAIKGANKVSKFSDEALKGANKEAESFKSSSVLVDMPINQFLTMAERLESPDPSKIEKTRELVKEGTPFSDVPYLNIADQGDGSAKVVGHEGRHRALALQEQGEDTIPVRLRSVYQGGKGKKIYFDQQSDDSHRDYVKNWPTQLKGESGGRLPFPVKQGESGKVNRNLPKALQGKKITKIGELPSISPEDTKNLMAKYREQDAKDMKFQEPHLYHGSSRNDIEEFKHGESEKFDSGWYGEGHHFTPVPEEAADYAGYNKHKGEAPTGATIYPVRVRSDKPFIVDGIGFRAFKGAIGNKFGDKILDGMTKKATKDGEFDQELFNKNATKFLKKAGHDSVWAGYDKTPTSVADASEVIVFDSKQVRSVNAKFDKKKASSGDIMAGIAGGSLVIKKISDNTGEVEGEA